ncbi:MAG: hypothetical protein ACOCWQ_05825, partial [Nanoarchaeota archaeon]
MISESFSGIRGIADTELTEEFVEAYARSYARYLQDSHKNTDEKSIRIIVGRDTRPSSARIAEQMISVITACGISVLDAGVNTTPAIELGVREYELAGGIIITGSHNPPEWNGWKFLSQTGCVLSAQESARVIEGAHQEDGPMNPDSLVGATEDIAVELRQKYLDFIISLIGSSGCAAIRESNFKVVADPDGGSAATIIKDLFEHLGVNGIYCNMELGRFPRTIEPNAQTLAYLSDIMADKGADLGAGWDCDADRVEFIIPENTEFARRRGAMVSGQYLLGILVDAFLTEDTSGNPIVVNDATSQLVHEIAARHGNAVHEVEVGEVNVVEKMYELQSPIAGEGSSSGAIVPPSRCRDGILALALVLRIMATRKKSVAEILESLPSYTTVRTNVNCSPQIADSIKSDLRSWWTDQAQKITSTGDESGGLKIHLRDEEGRSGW